MRVRERRIGSAAVGKDQSQNWVLTGRRTTSHTSSVSFPKKGKPRSAGSVDDDGEGSGAGSTSIGPPGRLPEQEDATYSMSFLTGYVDGRVEKEERRPNERVTRRRWRPRSLQAGQ